MDFNIRLENLIEERNIKQKQLALDLHIAPSTVNGYVSGTRQPGFDMLIRLSRYFDVSTDYLLGVSPEKNPSPSRLSQEESRLLGIYRSLTPEHKKLFTLQAELYLDLPK